MDIRQSPIKAQEITTMNITDNHQAAFSTLAFHLDQASKIATALGGQPVKAKAAAAIATAQPKKKPGRKSAAEKAAIAAQAQQATAVQ